MNGVLSFASARGRRTLGAYDVWKQSIPHNGASVCTYVQKVELIGPSIRNLPKQAGVCGGRDFCVKPRPVGIGSTEALLAL